VVDKEKRVFKNLIAAGINDKLSKKIINKGYSKTKLRLASKKELKKKFTNEEIDEIKKKIKRNPIPNHVINRLIVECDWKCCICSDITLNQPVETHHIEEHSKTHDDSFDNIVLLCLKHHGKAHMKNTKARDPLPPELLITKKAELIEKVKCFKELHIQSKTAIIHYTKRITTITKEKIKKDLYRTDFKDIIEISCSFDLLKDMNKWEIERKKQEEVISKIKNDDEILKDFMIFSMHRIPLVIHLGSLFRDGLPVKTYHFHREEGRDSWVWLEEEELEFDDHLNRDDSRINIGNNDENFIFSIELSGIIREQDITNQVKSFGGICKITANSPSQLWLKYYKQVLEFKELFYKIIGQIKKQNQSARKFHIFYYGPTPPAFIIGQAINTTILPEVYLYNYDGSKYSLIFKIKNSE